MAELLLVILVLSTQFAELTIVIFVTNLSVRRTDRSTELYLFTTYLLSLSLRHKCRPTH